MMLRTLREKVEPEHSALLIVDVQNDFCAEGGGMHREGRDLSLVQAMVPRLAALIEQGRYSDLVVLDQKDPMDEGLPGTMVLVGIFLLAFVVYYFVNWKLLSALWKVG